MLLLYATFIKKSTKNSRVKKLHSFITLIKKGYGRNIGQALDKWDINMLSSNQKVVSAVRRKSKSLNRLWQVLCI